MIGHLQALLFTEYAVWLVRAIAVCFALWWIWNARDELVPTTFQRNRSRRR